MVSIIIPSYNSQEFIEETIESAIKQSIVNEVIVIDDNSTDKTFEIVKRCAHPKLSVIQNKRNMGLAYNINTCVKMIKNEYFIILGHDDILPDNFVEKGMGLLLRSNSDFLFCNSVIIDSFGNKNLLMYSDFAQKIKFCFPKIFLCLGNFINSCGTIQTKKAFMKIGGYDESYFMSGEYLYWIKASSLFNFKYTSSIKSLYRVHSKNITKSLQKTNSQYIEICRQAAIKNLFCFLKS